MTCHYVDPMFCDGPVVRRIVYESPATCNLVSHCFCDWHSRVYWLGLTPELREAAAFQTVEIAA